jgi:hypothetical protein
MSINWLTKVSNFEVERREIPRSGGKPYRPMGKTEVGVLHTTEGPRVDSAWTTLRNHPGGPSAPHFIVGENRIVQCRPIGVQAAALKGSASFNDNQFASVQIEMCGFTGGNADFKTNGMKPWLPEQGTLKPLVALMAYCASNGIEIPLQRPDASWKDDCSDIKTIWAIDGNTRRKSGVWPNKKGWYYHLEVPRNNHYDCGAMRFSEILALAKELIGTPQPTQTTTPQPPASQPSTPSTSGPQEPSTAIIRQGDSGEKVKQLQTRLIALGLLGQGANDGDFGPRTLAAVRKFQSEHGLLVDGAVGPATNKAMDAALQSSSSGGNG